MTKIFEYELADAWGATISKVTVTDNEKDNVICMFLGISQFTKGSKPDVRRLTAYPETLNKIYDIYLNNIQIFDIESLGEGRHLMIDGYINKFTFALSDITKELSACNVGIIVSSVEAPKTSSILKVMYDVAKILCVIGVPKRYFRLSLEDKVDLNRYN